MAFYVYWIVSGGGADSTRPRSYIGATVDPARRLRQHNGDILGGARRTRARGDWRPHCVIGGFRTWREALQFEWAFQFYSRRCRGVASRDAALRGLLQKARWTSNSPPSSEVPLTVKYAVDPDFAMPTKSIKRKRKKGKESKESKESKPAECTTCGQPMNIPVDSIDFRQVWAASLAADEARALGRELSAVERAAIYDDAPSDPCDDCCCGACGCRKRTKGEECC